MYLLPRDRYQQVLLLLFLVFFVGSCIAPPYREFLLMQHVPTVLAALLLAYLSNRFVISRLSFSSIIVFLCLRAKRHGVGDGGGGPVHWCVDRDESLARETRRIFLNASTPSGSRSGE